MALHQHACACQMYARGILVAMPPSCQAARSVRNCLAGDISSSSWQDVLDAPFDGCLRIVPDLTSTTDLDLKAMADLSALVSGALLTLGWRST
jgi:hypothetical protein